MAKKLLKTLALLIVLFIIGTGIFYYWQHQALFPSTDDAYVQANVINIAPRVTGIISKVYVNNHQHVTAGQPLFDVDPSQFRVNLNKAVANLDETIQQVNAAKAAVITAQSMVTERQAELKNVRKDTRRTLHLVKEKLYSAAAGDKAESNLTVAEAAVLAAESKLQEAQQKLGHLGGANASIRAAKTSIAQAKLNLQYTHVVAPGDGYVANFTLREGDPITAYKDNFAIVENDDWWASANFKETDLERIKPGQKATIRIDMYPHVIFHGKVVSISAGSGTTFSLLPPENATGNWVKVTQRFPVRVAIDTRLARYPLRMGASCDVTIDTRDQKAP